MLAKTRERQVSIAMTGVGVIGLEIELVKSR
jgi:hypothetical protein